MSKTIKNYEFEGPFFSTSQIKKASGVYAVLCDNTVIDIGEGEDLKNRLDNHNREDCWVNKCKSGTRKYAAYYCDEKTRMAIEKELRDYYGNDKLCGDK